MRPAPYLILALLLLALWSAGCASKEATPTPTPRSAVGATVQAELPRRPGLITPTPESLQPEADPRTIISAFNASYRKSNSQWDEFNRKYEEWRQQLAQCAEEDRRSDLRKWVIDFQAILRSVATLEPPSGTAEVGSLVTDAAREEERGLRTLRDEWRPGDTSGFRAYEDARAKAIALRQEARSRLQERIFRAKEREAGETGSTPAPPPASTPPAAPAKQPTAGETPELRLASSEEMVKFRAVLDQMESSWQRFHLTYDEWRLRDGNCKKDAVQETLRRFVADFQTIAAAVFAVERPALVRPLAERLFEAAGTQRRALANLRDTWEAYSQAPYREFEAQKEEADRLRRQVASDLDQLLQQYKAP